MKTVKINVRGTVYTLPVLVEWVCDFGPCVTSSYNNIAFNAILTDGIWIPVSLRFDNSMFKGDAVVKAFNLPVLYWVDYEDNCSYYPNNRGSYTLHYFSDGNFSRCSYCGNYNQNEVCSCGETHRVTTVIPEGIVPKY